MVESPPADAGDTGSCPGPGRSHMSRSSWAREPWPLSLRSATGEAPTVRGPRTAKKIKIKECILSTWLIAVDVNLDHLAVVVFVRFLHCKVSLSIPLSILYFLEGSYYMQPTLK